MSASTSGNTTGWRRLGLMAALAVALCGCATGTNPKDPYEGFNRAMFRFNDTIDQAALKPAATAYKSVLPSFVQTGVSNFFGNLADVWTAANNLMQGKGEAGMSDVMRVALNSTFGFLGVLDIASEAGMQKHNEDFGQTLGSWGVKPGPYVMLPLLGPSTVRDTVVLPLDFQADPWHYKDPVAARTAGSLLRAIDQRADLLDASDLLEEAALDRYEFIRDSYLQLRESKVYDGESRPQEPGEGEGEKAEPSAKTAPAADAGPAVSSDQPK